jgi:hypothetical protein
MWFRLRVTHHKNEKCNMVKEHCQDTPKTAGKEGVTGSVKSQTVRLNFKRTDTLFITSSSIMSPNPLLS